MKENIKNMFKKIDWFLVSLLILLILVLWLFAWTFTESLNYKPSEQEVNEDRRAKICWTYSDKFWRRDVDYIDGKCYYKGKEVEIK